MRGIPPSESPSSSLQRPNGNQFDRHSPTCSRKIHPTDKYFSANVADERVLFFRGWGKVAAAGSPQYLTGLHGPSSLTTSCADCPTSAQWRPRRKQECQESAPIQLVLRQAQVRFRGLSGTGIGKR